jgi:hypothetical protein
LCDRLGFAKRDIGGIDFSTIEGFTKIEDADSAYFPGGLLQLSPKRKLGIIRIPLFSETIHPDLCTTVQKQLELADDAECDGYCGFRISIQAANLLTAALERRVESLQREGATAIVVDITGNGGGSDWVEPAARALSSTPLRAPRLAFLRHSHWAGTLRQQLDDVEYDLKNNAEPRVLLEQAATTMRKAIEETRHECDRSGVWNNTKPDCSLVVAGSLHSTGILGHAKPGTFAETMHSRGTLFHPSQARIARA